MTDIISIRKWENGNGHLHERLGLTDCRRVTLVGAGGKTSLMEALAGESSSRGLKTLLTTTTHILRPSPDFAGETCLVETEDAALLTDAFARSSLVCLGLPLPDRLEKWRAPSLSFLEQIAGIPERIYCEGDGSNRLPVKIPREGEPVFFPGSDAVVGVIGLSCLHKKTADCLFGRREGLPFPVPERVTPEFLYQIAASPLGLRKNVTGETFLAVFNQADLLSPDELREIGEIARRLMARGISARILSLKEEKIYLPASA